MILLLLNYCIIHAQGDHHCELILQFDHTVGWNDAHNIITSKGGNITHSIIEKGLNLNIYLAHFELNAHPDSNCFSTIDEAYNYFDCHDDPINDQTNGSSTKVKSVDYEYSLTAPTISLNSVYYDVL